MIVVVCCGCVLYVCVLWLCVVAVFVIVFVVVFVCLFPNTKSRSSSGRSRSDSFQKIMVVKMCENMLTSVKIC